MVVDPNVEENRRRMVELLSELTPGEGFHTTILDGVKLRRSDRNETRTPVMYEPSVYTMRGSLRPTSKTTGAVTNRATVNGRAGLPASGALRVSWL